MTVKAMKDVFHEATSESLFEFIVQKSEDEGICWGFGAIKAYGEIFGYERQPLVEMFRQFIIENEISYNRFLDGYVSFQNTYREAYMFFLLKK